MEFDPDRIGIPDEQVPTSVPEVGFTDESNLEEQTLDGAAVADADDPPIVAHPDSGESDAADVETADVDGSQDGSDAPAQRAGPAESVGRLVLAADTPPAKRPVTGKVQSGAGTPESAEAERPASAEPDSTSEEASDPVPVPTTWAEAKQVFETNQWGHGELRPSLFRTAEILREHGIRPEDLFEADSVTGRGLPHLLDSEMTTQEVAAAMDKIPVRVSGYERGIIRALHREAERKELPDDVMLSLPRPTGKPRQVRPMPRDILRRTTEVHQPADLTGEPRDIQEHPYSTPVDIFVNDLIPTGRALHGAEEWNTSLRAQYAEITARWGEQASAEERAHLLDILLTEGRRGLDELSLMVKRHDVIINDLVVEGDDSLVRHLIRSRLVNVVEHLERRLEHTPPSDDEELAIERENIERNLARQQALLEQLYE